MLKELKRKFLPAFEGLAHGLSDTSIRLQFSLAALAVVAGIFFKLSSMEWIAVIICIGMVIAAEILNTAIEYICNFLTEKSDEHIKAIKDTAAAAVLVSSLSALAVAIVIVVRHL